MMALCKRIVKPAAGRILDHFGLQGSITRNPFLEQKRLISSQSPVIFDAGAHHGSMSLLYRKLFPNATVYAFEPFPESFEQLIVNTSGDPAIKPFNFGLSNIPGQMLFSRNSSPATNSLLETDERSTETWGKGLLDTTGRITVPFSTIDHFIADQRIQSVDILKLDVQGAESLVLEGASRALADSKVHLIYSEIIIQPTYKDQKNLHEILAAFHDHGFALHDIYNLSRTSDGKLRQIDAIFTKIDKQHQQTS